MPNKLQQILSHLPSVNALLSCDTGRELIDRYGRLKVKEAIKNTLSEARQKATKDQIEDTPAILARIKQFLKAEDGFSLRRLINATGTVLHTNLGRAPLSPLLKGQFLNIAFSYSNLEYNIAAGKRGSRYEHITGLLKELTGAKDALVVNNNAAAVMLTLTALCQNQQVLISRGELVEIGGNFRIPDVICSSGGQLCEVGTTNKTHIEDYARAIGETTGAILKVHTSNFRLIGFSSTPKIEELAALAHAHDLPLIYDLGSGLFIDLERFGLPHEVSIKKALESGCDIVTFSGDKLLGGPQAGIIAGKKEYIEKMRQNQLLRALRVDKLTFAALEATLSLYRDESDALNNIPILKMLSLSQEHCEKKAKILFSNLQNHDFPLKCELVASQNSVGGGAYPEHLLPGYALALSSPTLSAERLEERLRALPIPVIARIKNDRVHLEMRTIAEEEMGELLNLLLLLKTD